MSVGPILLDLGSLRQPFDTPAATQDKAQDKRQIQAQSGDLALVLSLSKESPWSNFGSTGTHSLVTVPSVHWLTNS